MNWLVIFGTALVPMVVGFIWYNPKVLGNAWMQAAGVTPEMAKGANMAVIFGVTFVFSLMIAMALQGIVIHQMALYSILAESPKDEAATMINEFMIKYGNNFRTFKHGAFHGVIAGLFLALPVLGTNALFERKGFKYIAINTGYWVITFALMGGILCQFLDLETMMK